MKRRFLPVLVFLLSLAGFSAGHAEGRAQVVPGLPGSVRAGDPLAGLPPSGAATAEDENASLAAVIFSGIRTTTLFITDPGVYQFPAGATVRISAGDALKGKNAVEIKASGVTIEGLTVQGGYRGVSCQSRKNITLRDMTVSGGGIPAKGSRHGGSNIIFIDCANVTLERVSSTGVVGEHCFYCAQSATGYRLTDCVFETVRTPSKYQGVFQVNSESGSQATDFLLTRCSFKASSKEDVVSLMGAGLARGDRGPVYFAGGKVTGGRRFLATNYAARRSSFAMLDNVTLFQVKLIAEGGSWIHKKN